MLYLINKFIKAGRPELREPKTKDQTAKINPDSYRTRGAPLAWGTRLKKLVTKELTSKTGVLRFIENYEAQGYWVYTRRQKTYTLCVACAR
jgi:hypothetical protein